MATTGDRGTRLRQLSWLALALVFAGALAYGSIDDGGRRTDAERAAALARTIACPQCSGQPVSDSNAAVAAAIRTEIKIQVDEGRSDAEIRAYMRSTYGEWVDLEPARSGLTATVWILPFLATGVAVAGLALAFARWRGSGGPLEANAADRELVARALADTGTDDVGEGGGR